MRSSVLLSVFTTALVSTAVALPPDQPLTASSIMGHVIDSSGSSHAGEIHAYQLVIRDGHTELFPKCDVQTEMDGSYECKGLEAGRFIVQVWPASQHVAQEAALLKRPEEELVRNLFYPSATNLSDAIPLNLQPGQKVFADFRLLEGAGATISGSMAGLPGDVDFFLTTTDNHLKIIAGISVDKDLKKQQFTARRVPAGEYSLSATWNIKGVPHRAEATVKVGHADVTDVHLSEESFVTIKGTLRGQGADSIGLLLLYPCDDDAPKLIRPVVKAAFSFPAVPAGDYYIALPINSTAYIDGVSIGDKHIEYQRLHIMPESSELNLIVEVKPTGAALKGSLEDWAENSSKAQVVAVSETGQAYSKPVDKYGNYSFTELAPGSYRLFAWPGSDMTEYRNPAFLRRHERDGVSVDVGPTGGASVEPLSVTIP